MKNLNVMIKPGSSLCNMRCLYCFYADVSKNREIKSYGIMSDETKNSVLNRVESFLEAGDHVQFIFQGGEPTLAGLTFFKDFIDKVKKWKKSITVSYALQTNGLLIDEKWCEFLKENNFLVGISFDILSDCHNSARKDAEGNGTYKRVLDAIYLLDKKSVEYNVLCTLTNAIARYPQKVWKRIVELGIKHVQFTPCLGNLDEDNSLGYALTPKRFASFYIEIFKLWYDAYKKSNLINIKFFDDILNLMVLKKPTSCGMNGRCQPQLVVEADGSVYPCDFYCVDEYKLGNLYTDDISKLLSAEQVLNFVNRHRDMPILCEKCTYNAFCGGNCKRMQREICCKPHDEFCGYRDFLDTCGKDFNKIANEILYNKIGRI